MNDPIAEIEPCEKNEDQLLHALERVLASKPFAEVFRLRKFLEYVVTETIEGRKDRLKGFVIACDVFGKEDPTDAQTTTVVRVEAGRLRRRLKDYYEADGAGDPIRISIPKGGYAACFHRREDSTGTMEAVQAPPPEHISLGPLAWLAGAAILVVLFVALWRQEPQGVTRPEPATVSQPLIAVMPFQNLSGSEAGDPVAATLTEDIAIGLETITSIDVTSVSSVWGLNSPQLSPRAIGAELGATYILRGSIRALPPAPQITAGMFETKTGHQIWADHFTGTGSDFRELQRALVRRLTSSLSIEGDVAGINVFGQRFTVNKEAWQLYKQAMDLANPPSDPVRLDLARRAFENVIAMDPNFAGGYAGGAYVLAFKVFFLHSTDPDKDRAEALEFIRKSRELDPTFGFAHCAQAFLHISQKNFEGAINASNRAVEIQPNNSYINAYHGFIIGAAGDLEGGISFVERALRLDPLNPRSPYMNILGVLNYLAGNYTVARDYLIQNDKRGGPHGAGTRRFLAASYSKLGQETLAESVLLQANNLPPDETRWNEWMMSAFSDPQVPLRVMDEIALIKDQSKN